MEWRRGDYRVTDDKAAIDQEAVVRFLQQQSYWATDFSTQQIERSLEHSLCFSLHHDAAKRQVGFARVVTDEAVFGYVEDVFIDTSARGLGLGVWLMNCVVDHPTISALKKLMLATSDAHRLYEKVGFQALRKPETVMERLNTEQYKNFSWLEE